MVWVAMLMSDSFGRAGQLPGVVIGFILGQVEIRLLERCPERGQFDEGDVVGRSNAADGSGVQSGYDHGAVRSALDQSAALRQGLGQVGVLDSPDPDTWG